MNKTSPKQVQTATALPLSPHDSQHRRIWQYSIAMGIRMVCIALVFVVHGPLLLIPALGAIVLPYFAVIIANAGSNPVGAPLSPTNNALVRRDDTA